HFRRLRDGVTLREDGSGVILRSNRPPRAGPFLLQVSGQFPREGVGALARDSVEELSGGRVRFGGREKGQTHAAAATARDVPPIRTGLRCGGNRCDEWAGRTCRAAGSSYRAGARAAGEVSAIISEVRSAAVCGDFTLIASRTAPALRGFIVMRV